MRLQRTIKQEISFEGIGLHTGQYSKVYLKPARRDTGIIFTKLNKGSNKRISIKASVGAVTDTAFSTTLGYNGVKIRTVEHILAALSGLGIDNLIIEVTGQEIPILDGSSIEITNILLQAGIAKQGKKKPCLRVLRPFIFTDGNSEIAVFPFNGRKITYKIHFNHQLLGEQNLSIILTEESFIKEIAPARTFGFLKDVEYLRANGHAKGGSFENAIILGRDGILNSTGLRFKDEFVRHKILDLIGDLSLIGLPLYGHVYACKAGHSTNLKFLKKLLSHRECWEIVTETPQPSYVYT